MRHKWEQKGKPSEKASNQVKQAKDAGSEEDIDLTATHNPSKVTANVAESIRNWTHRELSTEMRFIEQKIKHAKSDYPEVVVASGTCLEAACFGVKRNGVAKELVAERRLGGVDTIILDRAMLMAGIKAYDQSRTTYTIDDTLLDALSEAKLADNIPCSTARLPKNGIALDLSMDLLFKDSWMDGRVHGRGVVFCFYNDSLESDGVDVSYVPVSWAVGSRNPAVHPVGSIDTTSVNLGEMAIKTRESLQEAFSHNAAGKQETKEALAEVFDDYVNDVERVSARIMKILMYINGNGSDLVDLTPKVKDEPAKADRQPKKEALPSKPSHYLIGQEFASVINRWKETEASSERGHDGSTRKPHMRGAHSHLYWTGVGRTIPVVHFLPPIPVKGWAGPEDKPIKRLVE